MSTFLEKCAKLAHEINRAYCQSLGDESQPSWEDAPEWQKRSALDGVRTVLRSPTMTPAQCHESWLQAKVDAGWRWGPEKDPEKKTHPCMVAYEDLPADQRAKDYLFRATVKTFERVMLHD